MSLGIDVDRVEQVLLADGWHKVADASFTLDAYEYLWFNGDYSSKRDPMVLHGGGAVGVCATGFQFKTTDWEDTARIMSGPLTAILAVRHSYAT